MVKEDLKKCNKCKELKQLSLFGRTKRTKSGLQTVCKLCRNNTSKLNKEKRKPIERFKEGFKKCTTCYIEKHVDSFPANKWCSMGVHSMCKDCNKNKSKSWIKENIEKARKNRNTHLKKRRKSDFFYKIKTNLRSSIKDSFINTLNGKLQKSTRTSKILGCSYEDFMNHIESQFLNWMKWENYGNCKSNEYDCSWHLDHVIPVTYAKSQEHLVFLNHWSNFQPLCSRKNVSDKRGKVLPVTNLELNITVGT